MLKVTDWDKAPLQSKKFLAYMFANVFMKLYLFYATRVKESDEVIMYTLTTIAFLDIGYIIGQAGLDAFIRRSAILSFGAKGEPDAKPDAKETAQKTD